jgi:hypothetical protein
MDRLQRLDKEEFLREMRAEADRVFGQVADAVNDAPDGNVINASEGPVRDLMRELRKTAFEKALQMRITASEAAFSPDEPERSAGEPARGEPGSDRGGPNQQASSRSTPAKQGRKRT